MALWAKIDVEMPTDSKLYGTPVVTRHLWTCLICLAKKQNEAGIIRGYDAALLAGQFNLPKAGVVIALTYFQVQNMLEVYDDGTLKLIHFEKRQGAPDTTNERSARYYDRHRDEILSKKRASRQQPNGSITDSTRIPHAVLPSEPHASPRETSPLELELEKELEKSSWEGSSKSVDVNGKAPAPHPEAWDPEVLKAVRNSLGLTDMDNGWGLFVGQSLQFPAETRHAAAREFLRRNCAKEGRDWPYLIGMMRNGAGRLTPGEIPVAALTPKQRAKAEAKAKEQADAARQVAEIRAKAGLS